jgi:hypothetical protein
MPDPNPSSGGRCFQLMSVNDLFEPGDWLLVAEDMTATAGTSPIVTVRTTSLLVWWLVGGGAALLVTLLGPSSALAFACAAESRRLRPPMSPA